MKWRHVITSYTESISVLLHTARGALPPLSTESASFLKKAVLELESFITKLAVFSKRNVVIPRNVSANAETLRSLSSSIIFSSLFSTATSNGVIPLLLTITGFALYRSNKVTARVSFACTACSIRATSDSNSNDTSCLAEVIDTESYIYAHTICKALSPD